MTKTPATYPDVSLVIRCPADDEWSEPIDMTVDLVQMFAVLQSWFTQAEADGLPGAVPYEETEHPIETIMSIVTGKGIIATSLYNLIKLARADHLSRVAPTEEQRTAWNSAAKRIAYHIIEHDLQSYNDIAALTNNILKVRDARNEQLAKNPYTPNCAD